MKDATFNEEFKKCRFRYDALKEQVANGIEMYAHLVDTEGPNIETQYMMLVGQFECQAKRLDLEVRRWKRRLALRQEYLNRGEKPDPVAIEAQLDKELAEWQEKINSLFARVKDSRLMWDTEKLSSEETSEIRCAYLKAVKKLHPDVNPDLPEAAVKFWNQIQQAKSDKDWKKLKFLVSLVDEVTAGQDAFDETPEGLEKMRAACARLEEKEHEVSRQIAELKATEPFVYLVLLEDEELLKERQEELKARIAELQEVIEKYERMWNNG